MSSQTSFPIFEDQQVLTSEQLNELRAYADGEGRLTRTKLIGIGTGCGLKVSFDSVSRQVSISAGVGTTSEGYLITLGDCVTDRYRPYTLPQGSNYAPFMNNNVQDVTLYELLTPTAPTNPNDVIVPLNSTPANFFDDKAVMLFVEIVDLDKNSCLGKKCDEFGLDRIFTVRKLLVSFSDLNLIIGRSEGFGSSRLYNPLFPAKYNLADSFMRRALFDPTQPNSNNYFDFSLNYAKKFRNDIFPALLNDLKQTYTVYQALLAPVYNNSNPFLDNAITTLVSTWTSYLNGSSTGPSYLGMQYFYDFVKDLILAYDEFRDTAFELVSECCPNMTRFPRHLMLGEVLPTGDCHPSPYRQEFIYSRLHDSQRLLLDKTISLHKRIVLQMRSFRLDLVNDPVASDVLIRITPSVEKRSRLSGRAVPYYYDLNTSFPLTSAISAEQTSLSLNWDHELARKCKIESGVVQVQAYGNQDANQLIDQGHIKTPLYYNLDPFNFYRVEGHLRKSYVDVMAELQDMKELFDLPFHIVALRLRGDAFDVVEDRCNFEDLRSQYLTTRARFLCMLDDACSRLVSVDREGIETAKFPVFLNRLLLDSNPSTGNQSVIFRDTTLSVSETGVVSQPSAQRGQAIDFSRIRTNPLEGLVDELRANVVALCRKLDVIKGLLPFEFKEFNYGADIADINRSFIKAWIDAVNIAISAKLSLDKVLDFIVRNSSSHPTKELYFVLSQYASEYIALLNKIIEDCTYREFEVIYYTFRYRVNYIRNNDPTLFSNFIKKHPGVDHKAGVQPGGTFIIVYNGDDITIDIKTRDEAISISQHLTTLRCREAVLLARPVKTKGEVLELANIQAQISKCIHLRKELFSPFAAAVPAISIHKVEIEEHQVIADFALPYLCCCDCDCDSIPAPGEFELNLPGISAPLFVEYNMGDYSFSRLITCSTTGCTEQILPLNIDVKDRVIYDRGAGTTFRLKFIQGGLIRTPAITLDRGFADTIITVGGGTVQIIELTPGTHWFRYTPLRGFVGVDSFEYIFELYDSNGVIRQSSTPGRVIIHVTNQCGLGGAPTQIGIPELKTGAAFLPPGGNFISPA